MFENNRKVWKISTEQSEWKATIQNRMGNEGICLLLCMCWYLIRSDNFVQQDILHISDEETDFHPKSQVRCIH